MSPPLKGKLQSRIQSKQPTLDNIIMDANTINQNELSDIASKGKYISHTPEKIAQSLDQASSVKKSEDALTVVQNQNKVVT